MGDLNKPRSKLAMPLSCEKICLSEPFCLCGKSFTRTLHGEVPKQDLEYLKHICENVLANLVLGTFC